MAAKLTRKRKIDPILAVLKDGFDAIHKHHQLLKKTFLAVSEDVETFDRNLLTFYKSTEQRFDLIHSQLDLITDMLARIHGIDPDQSPPPA